MQIGKVSLLLYEYESTRLACEHSKTKISSHLAIVTFLERGQKKHSEQLYLKIQFCL